MTTGRVEGIERAREWPVEQFYIKHWDPPPTMGQHEEVLKFAEKFAASEASRVRRETQWISVSERLPEKYKTVLAHVVKNSSAWIQTAWVACYGKRNPKVYWRGYPDDSLLGEVSHWMPLPEPPAAAIWALESPKEKP